MWRFGVHGRALGGFVAAAWLSGCATTGGPPVQVQASIPCASSIPTCSACTLHVASPSFAARVTGNIPLMPSHTTQAWVILPGQASRLMPTMPSSNVPFDIPIGNLTSMPNTAGNELRIYISSSCTSAPLILAPQ